MIAVFARLLRDERGQDLAEYAIALAVIATGVGLIAAALGEDIQSLWSQAEPKLQTVINAAP